MLFNSKVPFVKLSEIKFNPIEKKSKNLFEEQICRIIDSFCVSKIGRVESVRLSPNFTKIAYASFDLNNIVVFNIEFENYGINIINTIFIECELDEPHDFSWIDDTKIIVSNRKGPAKLFLVPDKSSKIKPILSIDHEYANGTNSVTVLKRKDYIRLFFCNIRNYISFFDIDEKLKIISNGIFLNKNLKFPDGIAICPSYKQIAITNPSLNNIIICDVDTGTNFFELNDINRPHSVVFINDNHIVSTGGNDPCLNFWNIKDRKIVYKSRILSNKQFSLRGSNLEGGVKGIDYCSDLNLLLLTCPNAPFLAYSTKN